MFKDKKEFEFVRMLESNWEKIHNEYLEITESMFETWIQREMYGEGWTICGLYGFGKWIEKGCKQCPQTVKILKIES